MTTKTISLKQSVLKGSAWTMVGIGAGQVIRLGKSLVLSRLLFPDAFGVMAIVWSVLFSLSMLSDVGLSAAVVRHQRGDDPLFLNTAWTMKVIRGVALCLVACIIAYPAAIFYHKPELAWLLPVAGLTIFIDGFGTTNVFSCQRKMIYDSPTLLLLANEVVSLIVTLTWAYYFPSVWALLGGAVVGAFLQMLGGHFYLPGIRNKFAWDSSAFRELAHFGKWIFFSSVVFLLYAQGDRMLLGRYLDLATLGIYSIALMLSETVTGVVTKLNNAVLYPALSRVVNGERERLREVFYRARLGTDVLFVMPIAALLMIGNELVHFLYDVRYHAAGWMFQILCIRLLMTAMLTSSESCLIALGHPRYSLIQNVCRATWILVGIPLGWNYHGIEGVVWVVALTEAPVIFVLWFGMARNHVLSLLHELRSLMFLVLGLTVGYGCLHLIGLAKAAGYLVR